MITGGGHRSHRTPFLLEFARWRVNPAEDPLPSGTPAVFAGGRNRFKCEADAKANATNIWSTLDRVREVIPKMFHVHGGDDKGSVRLYTDCN